MTTQLNQILAVVKGTKTQAQSTLTTAYHQAQKGDLFHGFSKTHTPRDADELPQPADRKQVQANVLSLIDLVRREQCKLFDVVFLQDATNCVARADIVVDGMVLLPQVPVTYLLFLEKQLVQLGTLLRALPTLSPAEEWVWDENAGLWRTAPVETVSKKQVIKHKVLYEATKEHPAQVQSYQEEERTGTWSNVKFSGAIPATKLAAVLEHLETLQKAVIFAREEANRTEVSTPPGVGNVIFEYLTHGYSSSAPGVTAGMGAG